MWEIRAFIPWTHRIDVEKSLHDKTHSASFLPEGKRTDLYVNLQNPFLGLKFRNIPESFSSESQVQVELKVQLKHNGSVEKWWKCVDVPISFEGGPSLAVLFGPLSKQLEVAQNRLQQLETSLHEKSVQLTSHHHSHKPSVPFFKKKIQTQIFLCSCLQKTLDLLRSNTFNYNDSLYEVRKVRTRLNVPVVELLPPHLIHKKKHPSQIKNKYLNLAKGKKKHDQNEKENRQETDKENESEKLQNVGSAEIHPPKNLAESAPRAVCFEHTEVEVFKGGKSLGKFQTIEFEGLKPKLLVTCLSSLDFPFLSASFALPPSLVSSSASVLSAPSFLGYPEFIQHLHHQQHQPQQVSK